MAPGSDNYERLVDPDYLPVLFRSIGFALATVAICLLPSALATLRAGGPPDPGAVEAERLRAERLVTRGRRRAWHAYLQEPRELAERSPVTGQKVERVPGRLPVEPLVGRRESRFEFSFRSAKRSTIRAATRQRSGARRRRQW